jgi:hypothetical protein
MIGEQWKPKLDEEESGAGGWGRITALEDIEVGDGHELADLAESGQTSEIDTASVVKSASRIGRLAALGAVTFGRDAVWRRFLKASSESGKPKTKPLPGHLGDANPWHRLIDPEHSLGLLGRREYERQRRAREREY